MIVTLIIGISFVAWRLNKQRRLSNLMVLLGAVGGITFIGTAVTTLYQMLLAASRVTIGGEALVTITFIIVPLAIGLVSLRISLRDGHKASVRKRIYYIILGVAALFVWAGLIIGPTLSIAASVMPTNTGKKG
jgi:hypothetical protein